MLLSCEMRSIGYGVEMGIDFLIWVFRKATKIEESESRQFRGQLLGDSGESIFPPIERARKRR